MTNFRFSISGFHFFSLWALRNSVCSRLGPCIFPELAHSRLRVYTSSPLMTEKNVSPCAAHKAVNFAMPTFETYSKWSSQGLFYADSWNDDTYTILPDGQEVRELPPKPVALLLHGLGSSSCFYHTITSTISSSIRCIALDYPGSGMSPPTASSSPRDPCKNSNRVN